jgi:CRISPR-associated protein Cas2
MTTRRYYLFCYDIASDNEGDKRRNKVFEALLARGDHVQFSVFICELNPRELAELRDTLIGILDHKKDQILYIDLGAAPNPLDTGIQAIGAPLQLSTPVLVV